MSTPTPRIGVFGAAFAWSSDAETIAQKLADILVRERVLVVTGATSGLPYQVGRSVVEQGGTVIGISPAANESEHVQRYGKPLDGCSFIMWTGGGYTGRNYLNVRNCDAALIIGGEFGTLEEFCIAFYEGKVIGVLESSGGIASEIRRLCAACPTSHGARVIFGDDAEDLVHRVISALGS